MTYPIGASICLVGVASSCTPSMIEPDESKALVRRLVETVSAGDLEGLEQVAEGDKAVGYLKCSGTPRRLARHPTERQALRGRGRGLHLPRRAPTALVRNRRNRRQLDEDAPARDSAVNRAARGASFAARQLAECRIRTNVGVCAEMRIASADEQQEQKHASGPLLQFAKAALWGPSIAPRSTGPERWT
jgi:hypothetical protein